MKSIYLMMCLGAVSLSSLAWGATSGGSDVVKDNAITNDTLTVAASSATKPTLTASTPQLVEKPLVKQAEKPLEESQGDVAEKTQVIGMSTQQYQQWQAAQQCTALNERLNRLNCFDSVFKTPVWKTEAPQGTHLTSPSLIRALESEKQRQSDNDDFISNYADPARPAAGMWVTIPVHSEKTHAILMFSCINNISRVELVFDHSLSKLRFPVTIDGYRSVTQVWSVDESGQVLTSGRGLLAIDLMRAMLPASQSRFRSDEDQINNLVLSAPHLATALRPLRHLCQW